MKKLILTAVAVFTLASAPVLAQTSAVSGSNSTATATNTAASAAISGASNQNIFTSPANTTAEIKNVPAISAPSLGGGGHPCLAAVSGGIAGLGGGLSLGKSDAEVVCMLAFMGQHEAAVRALVAKSPAACKAIGNVGYYVIAMGNGKTKAVAFNCGETVKGGVYSTNTVRVGPTPTASTKSTSVRPKARPEFAVDCQKRGNNIVPVVTQRVADFYSRDQIKAACRG